MIDSMGSSVIVGEQGPGGRLAGVVVVPDRGGKHIIGPNVVSPASTAMTCPSRSAAARRRSLSPGCAGS